MRRPTYSSALMNNTKWREVLSLVGRMGESFEVTYVWEKRFQSALPPAEDQLSETHIADPGIAGGPAEYSYIYSIRIPKKIWTQNPKTGEKIQSTEKSDRFLMEAAKLGLLPLEIKGDFIYVYGYSHRNP
jgi:hypothetical protein